jgi:hypothetical protein
VGKAVGELAPDIVIRIARLWTHVKKRRVEDAVEIARKLLESGWALIDIAEGENAEDALRWLLYLVGDLGIKVKELCTQEKCILLAKQTDVARIATAVSPKTMYTALSSGADLDKLLLLRFTYIRAVENPGQPVTFWLGAPAVEVKFCKQEIDTCIESTIKYIEWKLKNQQS